MGNIVPDKTSIEHDGLRKAKRVIPVDPFGGLVTSGNLSVALDEVSSSVTYVGFSQIGTATSAASWQVKKLTTTGTVTTITWADGNDLFDNIWDNRASLTYS